MKRRIRTPSWVVRASVGEDVEDPAPANFKEWLETPTAGMAIYACSALWVSLMGVGVKYAKAGGASVLAIILARTIIGIVLALTTCKLQGINPLGRQRQALVVRGLVGCGGIIGLLIAAARLPLAVCSLLGFVAPLMTALCAVTMLAEPIPGAVLAGALTSLAGVTLVLQPWAAFGGMDPLGVSAAIVSPLCIGAAGVMVRKLASGGEPEHPQVVMIYLSVITTCVVLLYAMVTAHVFQSWQALYPCAPALLLVGITGWLNQLCITMGLARAPAAKATAMGYLQVVFAAAADYLLFGLLLSPTAAMGGLIIVSSAVLVAINR